MAKVTGPLLSIDSRGQIANSQVYSSWKGRAYARRYTIPANPKSDGQMLTRNTFGYISALWKLMPALAQAPWAAYAKGKVLTDRNAFQKSNLANLRSTSLNELLIGSPGSNGGLAPTSLAAVDAGGQAITVTLGVPDVPAMWTITDSVALAVLHGDPAALTDFSSFAGHTGDDTGIVTIDAKAGTFVVTGWFVMTKPDGSVAYSPSLTKASLVVA